MRPIVAEEVSIPLSVLLAFGFGLALGILAMFIFAPPQPVTAVAGTGRIVVQRDEAGRILAVQGVG